MTVVGAFVFAFGCAFLGSCETVSLRFKCSDSLSLSDSVMKMKKKNFPQLHLEECKYKTKKMQMSRFINTELDSDSESESDAELIAKLKSNSDNDSE